MKYTTTVTQKGQATIPAIIRKKLGLKTNSKIIFEMKNENEAMFRPVTDFLSLQGSIKSTKPFDIEAMEKSVGEHLKKEYGKDST